MNTRWKALDEIYLRPCVVKMNERKMGQVGKEKKENCENTKEKTK